MAKIKEGSAFIPKPKREDREYMLKPKHLN